MHEEVPQYHVHEALAETEDRLDAGKDLHITTPGNVKNTRSSTRAQLAPSSATVKPLGPSRTAGQTTCSLTGAKWWENNRKEGWRQPNAYLR